MNWLGEVRGPEGSWLDAIILQEVRKRTGLVKLACLVVRKVAGLMQLYTTRG